MREKGVTIIELTVVIGIFLAVIAVLAPFVNMVKVRTQRMDCANSLRKISLGLHAYAVDHNGAFPASLGELYPDYVDDQSAFNCPATKAVGTKDAPEFNYEPGLTESSNLKDIVAGDIDGNHKKAGKNILRVNGSVDWVKIAR